MFQLFPGTYDGDLSFHCVNEGGGGLRAESCRVVQNGSREGLICSTHNMKYFNYIFAIVKFVFIIFFNNAGKIFLAQSFSLPWSSHVMKTS